MDTTDELVPIVEQEHGGVCQDGACLNRTLSSPKEEYKSVIAVNTADCGGGLPTLGLVTREQRDSAKAHPPPPQLSPV